MCGMKKSPQINRRILNSLVKSKLCVISYIGLPRFAGLLLRFAQGEVAPPPANLERLLNRPPGRGERCRLVRLCGPQLFLKLVLVACSVTKAGGAGCRVQLPSGCGTHFPRVASAWWIRRPRAEI